MLKFFKGIVSSACEACNISRQTYYRYYNDDPAFAQEVDEINEASIDHVESKLMEKINGVSTGVQTKDGLQVYEQPPSDTAIIFFLKTKGKKRGYVERVESQVITEQPLFGDDQ